MKMNYEAPITELIYFRSEDILAESNDDLGFGDGIDDNEADMANA